MFGALGAARDCLETAIDYARAARGLRQAARGFQLTQEKLADMTVELGKGMLLALHLGRLKDAGRVRARAGQPRQAQQRPRGPRHRPRVPDHPGRATASRWSTPVLRHANNLESVLTYEGTSEMHLLSIGQALTGQAAFR